jgi:DNA polymerase (family 10)
LNVAEEIADAIVDRLKKVEGVREVIVGGSYRRKRETVADLDILATCKKGSKVMDAFVHYENVEKVVAQGDTRSTVVLRSGVQMDLRVVPGESYGAALHYFTGSKAHNIAVRTLGVKKGLKINEYGVFKGKNRIAGKTEEEVFNQVDLPFIDPELREDRGEIEAARKGKLPSLITLKDIRGDLHAHTKATDGRHSLEQMVEAARDRGYQYLAITEHSKRLSMTHGFDAERLARRNEEIDRLNEKLKGFVVLKSIEVDILTDGSLDLPDSILRELDLTVCSVHSRFNLPREKQMERILRAMDNPYFNVFAHPSGRLINEREPYDIDIEVLMKAAKDRGCIMEVNAHPDRLDLTDTDCKLAKEMGVKVVISTDAHSITDLDLMRFGVWQGRRGWLERKDVLNTRPLDELRKLVKRK